MNNTIATRSTSCDNIYVVLDEIGGFVDDTIEPGNRI